MAKQRTLIVGGGTGIGFGCAKALAKRPGMGIFLTGRRDEPLRTACSQLPYAGWATGDATNEPDVIQNIEMAVAFLGGLDTVIIAAGASGVTPVDTTETADFTRLLHANLMPVFLFARHSTLHLRKSTNASFIAISSIYGLVGQRDRVAYCSGKAAVNGFIRAMALDLAADGIRANALCPGFVETELSIATANAEPDPAEALAERRRMSPIRRGGTVEEIGAMADFLASDKAAWITGQAIAIDGGYTAR